MWRHRALAPKPPRRVLGGLRRGGRFSIDGPPRKALGEGGRLDGTQEHAWMDVRQLSGGGVEPPYATVIARAGSEDDPVFVQPEQSPQLSRIIWNKCPEPHILQVYAHYSRSLPSHHSDALRNRKSRAVRR